MVRKNRIRIITFLVLSIVVIASVSIALDWNAIITGQHIQISFYNPARILKRLISLLALLIVFISGRESLKQADHRLLAGIFILIVTGDFLLLFNLNSAGIGLFILVQILFIARHAVALKGLILYRKPRPVKVYLLVTTVLTVCSGLIVFYVLYSAVDRDSSMIYIIALYIVMITVSLSIAFQTGLSGYFPAINYRLIIAGMIFFYLCDITVGVRMVYADDHIRSVATAMTWIFYAPALTLLALSGLKFNIGK